MSKRPSEGDSSAPKRQKTSMPIRETPSGGLRLSALGFGTWQFGSKGEDDYWAFTCSQDHANMLVTNAVDCGYTYFDTAEDYGGGDSERQLGVALKTLSGTEREAVVVGSKILPNHCGEVEKYLDGTLERLGLDCIDLYMVHWPIEKASMAHFAGGHTNEAGGRDYAVADADAVHDVPPSPFEELARLQAAGKIKHVGVSNFGVQQLEEALATGVKIAINELAYNMVFRAIEHEIVPFCVKHGIGIAAYSPLGQGLLTGRWSSADEVPAYRARTRHFDGKRPKSRHGESGHEELLFKSLASLRKISEERSIPLADLALAWPLANPAVTTVIAGASKPEQAHANALAANIVLSPEVIAEINDATKELKEAMGGNADLWQGGADSRIR